MEKQFAYPLAIEGTYAQFRELIPSLVNLGYKDHRVHYDKIEPSRNFLVTNATNDIGDLSIYLDPGDVIYNRTRVSAEDTELVLALAAMTTNDTFFKGEYVTRTIGKFSGMNVGDIDQLMGVSLTASLLKYGTGHSVHHLRKSTLDEIMHHLNKNKKEEPKVVIGYKVPEDLFHQKVLAGEHYVPVGAKGEFFKPSSMNDNQTAYFLPVELVKKWEPIYRQTKKELLLNSGTSITVTRDGTVIAKYKGTNLVIDISDLKGLVPPTKRIGSYSVEVKNFTLHIGCSDGPDVTSEEIALILKTHKDLQQ